PLAVLFVLGLAIYITTGRGLAAVTLPLAALLLGSAAARLREPDWSREEVFVLALAAAGVGIIGVCELVYLKDTFDNRLITILKFYYQAWLWLSVAGAYGAYRIAKLAIGWLGRFVWSAAVVALCAAASLYAGASFYTKADNLRPSWTLDGSHFLQADG